MNMPPPVCEKLRFGQHHFHVNAPVLHNNKTQILFVSNEENVLI